MLSQTDLSICAFHVAMLYELQTRVFMSLDFVVKLSGLVKLVYLILTKCRLVYLDVIGVWNIEDIMMGCGELGIGHRL